MNDKKINKDINKEEKSVKDIIITVGFIFILTSVFILNIIIEDTEISKSERRKLASLPKITFDKIVDGDVSDKFDKYTTDQFISRDFFRNLKTSFNFNVYLQKDDNKLFEKDGAIYNMDYPLNESNLNKSLNVINKVYNKYLNDMNVYYSIIPDKNYYLTNDDHLKMNYDKLKNITAITLNKKAKYIDIFNTLDLNDYYRTDLHWRQENLEKVANKIKIDMGLEKNITKYNLINQGKFYGTYYSQLSTNVLPDSMYILTNETLENCYTYNYETNKNGKIYDFKNTYDKYDIYLSGATPIIEIINPSITEANKRELLLFRDSFGSSLAPLLIETYSKITLIDLRYVSSNLLDKYITFDNQDVLFLYSTLILNQNVLK